MVNVHNSIVELPSNFKPSQVAVTLESHTQSSTSTLFSERQIRRLENQLEYRNQEIREIRNQLVTSSILKQNFELKDCIAHLKTELANKKDEVIVCRNKAIQLALANFGLPYSLLSDSGSHDEHDHQHPGNFTLHPTSTDRTFKSIAIAVKAGSAPDSPHPKALKIDSLNVQI
ncbi:hypothetical protein PCANC_20255 [Puccinia coronata f. sp. avenae]|uniref:Uncharacterized protein n=1 Tax=Puccinia coronata f. sp. avenae TaxID=200324 RepID=A0A2N5SHD3_9BASI|nr:hypothetical protein PCANC_20255 [Puccinia coronata f. sp. avenae]